MGDSHHVPRDIPARLEREALQLVPRVELPAAPLPLEQLPLGARRALGASERLFVAFRRFTATNVVRVLAIEGRLPPERIASALPGLRARYPLLRARIEGGGKPAFVHGAAPALRLQVSARRDDQHWRELLERELATAVDTLQGPPLRLHYLYTEGEPRAELLVVADHAICDGLSINALCADLVASCAGTLRRAPSAAVPVLDALLPRFDLRTQLAAARRVVKALALTSLRRAHEEGRRSGSTTRFASVALTREETQALLARTRAEQTTLTGALMAAVAAALAQERAHARLALSIPVNVRPYLSGHRLRAEHLGNYTSVAYLDVARGRALWPHARLLKRELTRAASPEGLLPALGLTYRLGRLFVRAERPSLSHALISNSGVVPIARDTGGFRVRDFYSATSAAMLSADFGFFCNTFAGQLRINLVYLAETVATEAAERVLADVRQRLSRLDADGELPRAERCDWYASSHARAPSARVHRLR